MNKEDQKKEFYKSELSSLQGVHSRNSTARDKYVFSFGTAILTFSFTFMNNDLLAKCWLIASWVLLFLCMASGIVNFSINDQNISLAKEKLDAWSKSNSFESPKITSCWGCFVSFFNIASTVFLLFGMLCLLIFSIINLY